MKARFLKTPGRALETRNELYRPLLAGLVMLFLVFQAISGGPSPAVTASAGRAGDPMLLSGVLLLTVFMFVLLYANTRGRTLIMVVFAGKFMFAGLVTGYYKPVDAYHAVRFDVLSLLLGMEIFSLLLEEAGLFSWAGRRLHGATGDSPLKLLVLLCLSTYCFSLGVNNLTTILVMAPATLRICTAMRLDPRPFIIGEIIAANLGGASSMLGDFPNMLIASEAGIGFFPFIQAMMPVCLVQLAVLLFFLGRSLPLGTREAAGPASPFKTGQNPSSAPGALGRTLIVLSIVILLFPFCGAMGIKPGAFALLGSMVALPFSGLGMVRVLNRVTFGDLLFFTGLFIVAGAVAQTGFMDRIASAIVSLSSGKLWAACLLLMWSAAIATAFLNAGPACALFLPVVGAPIFPCLGHTAWWALSLGVLAGSSATLFGATSGPVVLSFMERHAHENGIDLSAGKTFTGAEFSRLAIPVSGIFLIVSSLYILLLIGRF